MIEVRDRTAGQGARRRAARQARRSLRPLMALGLAALVGAGCAAYLLDQIDRTALVSAHTYRFAVSDATAVSPGVDEVRFKGIPAGKITGVSLHGTQPVMTVQLESRYGRLYRDATAQLRPNTPLQDMYLNITSRGTPAAGPATGGRPIAAAQTSTSVDVSDVLDVFGSSERAKLAALLSAFGNGLADRGAALRDAFVQLVPFVVQAGRITGQLGRRSRLTRQLVHNTGVLTTTLGSRATELRALITEGTRVAGTLGVNAGGLKHGIAQLPGTIVQADRALDAVQGVLPSVTGAARSLEPVAARLPSALGNVRTLSRVARPAVTALQRPVSRLVPLTGALKPVAASLQSSATELAPQIGTLNHVVSDIGQCLPQIYGFFAWNASMAKFGDSRGGAPRGDAAFGASSLAGAKSPFEFPETSCTAGAAIGGRLPTTSDYR